MFKKTILTAATLAVALVAFQPAAQASSFSIKFGGHGHGNSGHGHGGWGHGGWGHGGHGGWGHGGHGGWGHCFLVKKKYWHKGHGHFHFKKVKVCK